jgi:hypothetical protein
MKPKTAGGLLVACVASGAALLWMAVRPCEPVAQAAEAPVVSMVPALEAPVVVKEDGLVWTSPEITVVGTVPSHKPLAGVSKNTAMGFCTAATPGAECHWEPSSSTANSFIEYCDCK